MTVERTLARVEEDLQAGNRALARERLRGLCGSFPQRLDLRERLGALYREDGESAQAGRWLYLSDTATPDELRAFERSHRRNPKWMMWALGWRGSEDEASTQLARERLRELRQRAESKAGGALSWERPREPAAPPTRAQSLIGNAIGTAAVLVLVLILIGLVSLAFEGWDVLTGWFE